MSGENLSGLKLLDVNLSAIDFSRCDLSNCIFEGANFKGAKFIDARLCFSQIEKSDISYCTFNSADLYSLYSRDCKFTGSEFIDANLSSIRMESCRIDLCDFRRATTTGMVLDSRTKLKKLIHFLSDSQLSGIVFKDELDLENSTKFRAEIDESPSLIVTIESGKLTPFNLSYFLLAIEGVYNNLLYLSQTSSNDIDEICNSITPYYQGVGASESLMIKKVYSGSVIVELTTLAASAAGILYTLSKTIDVIGRHIIENKKLQLEATKNSASIGKIEAETDKIIIENTKLLIEMSSSSLQASDDTFEGLVDYDQLAQSMLVRSEAVGNNKQYLFEKGIVPLEEILSKYNKMGVSVTAQINS